MENRSTTMIPEENIEAVGRDILEASTLPGECYWRADIYQREIEKIFFKEWICVGRVEDIPNPGDFMTESIANEPLIIVRGAEGEIHVHLNVCRHRGCQLVEGSGTTKAFRCPYHGWMYGLGGDLRGTPDFNETKNFDKKDYPLHSAKVEVWDGFIMVNLDPDATPFADRISETDRWGLEKYRLGSMVTTHRWEYQLDCNWKAYVENYIEAYHVPWVHAETFQPVTPLKDWHDFPDISDQPWSVMIGQTPGVSLSDNADALFPISPDLADMPPEFDGMPIWLVYPTFMVIPVVDCMIYYVAHPRGPERCDIKLRLCLPEEVAEKYWAGDPEIIEGAGQYARNTEAFILEDNKVTQMQQVGLRSSGALPGRFSYHEALARQFDHWVAETAYLGGGNGSGASAG